MDTLWNQEKRICRLVKEKYLTRLKHREISLCIKGKKFLNENSFIDYIEIGEKDRKAKSQDVIIHWNF